MPLSDDIYLVEDEISHENRQKTRNVGSDYYDRKYYIKIIESIMCTCL